MKNNNIQEIITRLYQLSLCHYHLVLASDIPNFPMLGGDDGTNESVYLYILLQDCICMSLVKIDRKLLWVCLFFISVI